MAHSKLLAVALLALATTANADIQLLQQLRHADQQAWAGSELATAKSALEIAPTVVLPTELEAKRWSVQAHVNARLAGVAPPLPDLPKLDIAPDEGFGLDCASAVPLDGTRALRFTAFPDRPTYFRLAPGAERRQINTFGSEVDVSLTEIDCEGKIGQYSDDALGLQAAISATDAPMVVRVDVVSEPGQVVIQAIEATVFVTGRLLRASDSSPVVNVRVEFRRSTFSIGSGISAVTDTRGVYRITTANTLLGDYVISTLDARSIGLADGVYPRGYCSTFQCDQTNAQQFSVTGPLDIEVSDFLLDLATALELRLTSALGGAPVPGAAVSFLNRFGNLWDSKFVQSDSQGIARASLTPGTVQVRVDSAFHLRRLVRGIDCPLGNECLTSAATVIPVTSGAIVVENEVLTPTTSIALTLPGVAVASLPRKLRALREDGLRRDLDIQTSGPTTFSAGPLEPGRYKIAVEVPGFFGQLNDGTDCIAPCDPAISASFVDIVVGGPNPLQFVLRPWPSLTVELRDADSAMPITPGLVTTQLLGVSYANFATDSNGRVVVSTPPGLTLVRASSDSHRDQIFDGVVCELDPPSLCPNATPLLTDLSTSDRTIRFDLVPAGRVSGRIRSHAGGVLSFPTVSFITGGALPLSGFGRLQWLGFDNYELRDIPPVQKPLGASEFRFFPSVFENIFCPVIGGVVSFGGCNLSTATPIQITRGEHIQGVDFFLEPRYAVRGRVVDRASGNPISGLTVVARQPRIGYLAGLQSVTDAQGRFVIPASYPESFVIHTAAPTGWVNQAFSGRVCALSDPDCSDQWPFATPVQTQVDTINPDQIEFRLDPVADLIYSDGFD